MEKSTEKFKNIEKMTTEQLKSELKTTPSASIGGASVRLIDAGANPLATRGQYGPASRLLHTDLSCITPLYFRN